MFDFRTRFETGCFSRRDMLQRCGTGLGMMGLAVVLDQAGMLGFGSDALAASDAQPLAPKRPQFQSRARQVVHLFMNGGPSHVDTFDPKPLLEKFHGQPLPAHNLRTERPTGGAMASPFKFSRHGQSGIQVSELFSKTAEHVDQMAIIRSMHADVPNHGPSLLLMNCGDGRLPRPSMGAWVNYGLGSENQNLPGFVVLCPDGYPTIGARNWGSAFLPGAFQGTFINTKHSEIEKLIANIKNNDLSAAEQRRQLDLVRRFNKHHLHQRGPDNQLEARIQSFELAFRMQTEATDAFDISREPKYIQEMYGSGTIARQLLITRRLLEKGVRFIQVWSGKGQPWDDHNHIKKHHRQLAHEWDQPLAAFLKDLKQRGMFDSTLIQWGGEFGRTPTAEMPGLDGRDHNHYGFTCWLAGGGVRGGYVHGATDEFGYAAVEDRVHVHDLHATMLHLLGFDHQQLTYRYAGRDFRLTDVHGRVVKELIA